LGYAAPEQWELSGKQLDGRCDLYALGATMYKMLTGHLPYPDAREVGVWYVRARQPPVPPAQLRADTPRALSELVLRMLAFYPEDRPADAAKVLKTLEATQAI
jgi:serine/threonine protein kinase